jgi:hypothetical protein
MPILFDCLCWLFEPDFDIDLSIAGEKRSKFLKKSPPFSALSSPRRKPRKFEP